MIGNEGPTHQLGGPGPIEVVYLKGLRRQLEEAKTEEEIVRIQGLIDAQLAIEASHRRLD